MANVRKRRRRDNRRSLAARLPYSDDFNDHEGDGVGTPRPTKRRTPKKCSSADEGQNCRTCVPVWNPDSERFARICQYFLQAKDRERRDPRPGTMVWNWAVGAADGHVGAGILLSSMVYFSQTKNGRPRLKSCEVSGLRDWDLNVAGADYLRRPFRLDYASIYDGLGLSQRQVVDAVEVLRQRRLIEIYKVPGHRGPVLVLNEEYHHELAFLGRLERNCRSHPDLLEWATWLNASEIIAMPRLAQALVLARWLRWLEWTKRQQRPNNTHGQIAEQIGLSGRSVQRTMKKIYEAGVLKADAVKKKIGAQRAIGIPSPTHGREEREQLTRLVVEALAKRFQPPAHVDLTEIWSGADENA